MSDIFDEIQATKVEFGEIFLPPFEPPNGEYGTYPLESGGHVTYSEIQATRVITDCLAQS